MNKTLLSLPLFSFIFPTFLFSDIFSFQTINKANEAYSHGEFRKSARLFNTLEKNNALVAYNRANAYYKAEQYDLAEKSYLQAKGVDEAMRMHNLGNVYFKKRDFTKAIVSYESSLLFRDDKDTQYNLELAKIKRDQNLSKNTPRENQKKPLPHYQKVEKNQKREKSLTKEEEIRKKELTHLLKQVSKKKMPSMLYRIKSKKREEYDGNPW